MEEELQELANSLSDKALVHAIHMMSKILNERYQV